MGVLRPRVAVEALVVYKVVVPSHRSSCFLPPVVYNPPADARAPLLRSIDRFGHFGCKNLPKIDDRGGSSVKAFFTVFFAMHTLDKNILTV